MEDSIFPEENTLYKVKHNDDDLIHNLHMLYEDVCDEPVPDYLLDLLRKLPR